jgi:hypothetical protein
MTTSRIDHLRTLVAGIGATQLEYHQFFPAFADRLENELGNYLGSRESVALCCAYGDFTFDQGSYRHAGLGFEAGRYRIPFMFRLKNLKDDGDFLVRVRLYFTREDAKLSVQIDGEGKLEVDENDTAPLTECIYRHLCNVLAKSSWFEQNKADYQSTAMGFTSAA